MLRIIIKYSVYKNRQHSIFMNRQLFCSRKDVRPLGFEKTCYLILSAQLSEQSWMRKQTAELSFIEANIHEYNINCCLTFIHPA